VRVEFTPQAEDDIDRLYQFLVEKNPLAAQKAMLAIDDLIEVLSDQPRLGKRLESLPDFRQMPVTFGRFGYVLQYRIQEDALIVLRIWAGRENR